jgi:phage-related protein
MAWTVTVVRQAADAIEAWPVDLRASLSRIVERIEAVGLDRVHEPIVKHLEGDIWEMRPSGRDVIGRALYVTRRGRSIVIVHAFVKKTAKTPRRELETAIRRAREIDR